MNSAPAAAPAAQQAAAQASVGNGQSATTSQPEPDGSGRSVALPG